MFRLSPWLLLLPFLLLEATGCATNPYTKRWQLLMIPRSYEANLGTQAYQDVLSDPKVTVSKNPAEVGPVERTAARIEATSLNIHFHARSLCKLLAPQQTFRNLPRLGGPRL